MKKRVFAAFMAGVMGTMMFGTTLVSAETPELKGEVYAFIAASLNNAMEELQKNFNETYPDVEILYNAEKIVPEDYDNGSSYETGGEIVLDAQKRVELYECYVYRTPAGDYYAECVLYNGMKSAYCGPGFGLKQTRTISAERPGDWSVSGKTQSHSIKVSVSFVEHTAAERLVFAWLRGDKSILSREEYGADALPETLTAPDGASMLVVTQTSADGTSARSLCTQDDLFARAYVPSMLSGLLRVVDVSLDWGKEDF